MSQHDQDSDETNSIIIVPNLQNSGTAVGNLLDHMKSQQYHLADMMNRMQDQMVALGAAISEIHQTQNLCKGQDVDCKESVPATPRQASKVPEPQTPQVPTVSKVPEPQTPQVPTVLKVPETPRLTNPQARVPTIPKVLEPQTPQVAKVPESQTPRVPQTPRMTEVPVAYPASPSLCDSDCDVRV